MTSAQSSNQTLSRCTAPLLDQSLFSQSGGYLAGRNCGLGSFEDGTTCCFPCPIQDWLYHPGWQEQFRVPNYLSMFSVALCTILLISFAVLPPEITHRHYLSIGLIFSVLSISLSFAIPLSTNPSTCYDAITPHDMGSSTSCAWTGSLVTVGGIGSVVWVFLRSLWLHVRIVWDLEPGRIFKWTSIIVGTALPLVFLGVLLSVTGFSYRMGQTCLPNHKHAIVTFWVWLLVFSVLAFVLQSTTTGYCFFVYLRTLRREKRASVIDSCQRGETTKKLEAWSSVKQLFILQWRNILLSIFVILGSVAFFVVFWTQDGKLGRVFNDPENIIPVKTWIICLTLSMGNRELCRRYVAGFTVDETSVLVGLIMASLVGLSVFILLFRLSFIPAWITLFTQSFHRFRSRPTPLSPQLTSLDDPDKYQQTPMRRSSSRKIFTLFKSANEASPNLPLSRQIATITSVDRSDDETELESFQDRPLSESTTCGTRTVALPSMIFCDDMLLESQECLAPPIRNHRAILFQHVGALDSHLPSRRWSSIIALEPSFFTSTREAPPPPPRPSSVLLNTQASIVRDTQATLTSCTQKNHTTFRSKIAAPIPGSFKHVSGAFTERRTD